MKVIYPNLVAGVTATTENANYPDDNLIDSHPKKVWRATATNSEVTAAVNYYGNCVGVFGINAVSVALTVKNTGVSTILSKVSYDLKTGDPYYSYFSDDYVYLDSYWIDYTYQSASHFLVVEFEAATGVSVEAGVIRAGVAKSFMDADWSLTEGYVDYSIVSELSNGALYIKDRDIVRTYSGVIPMMTYGDFYHLARGVVLRNKSNPLAWRVTDRDENYWAIFARCDALPVVSHSYRENVDVDFSLIEVL